MWLNIVLFICRVPAFAFSVTEASALDTECSPLGTRYGMVEEEFFAEWDLAEGTSWPLPLEEWQDDEEMEQRPASILKQCPTPVDSEKLMGQPEKGREAVIRDVKASDTVTFVCPKSPEDFVEHWPAQKRLFEGIPHPFSPEQVCEIRTGYYPFVAAGKLLEELGKEEFLDRFGEGSVRRMQRAAHFVIRQRKAVERDRGVTVDVEEVENVESSGTVTFARFNSPRDFTKRWSAQKRLFESLPRPYSPEQYRALQCIYYPFTAAGRLLDELGTKVFLRKFRGESLKNMVKIARTEAKQQKAVEEEQITAIAEGTQNKVPDAVTFMRFKSPEEFVECWSEQKFIYENLPRPLSPKQYRELQNTYYRFTAAGQLLEELGKEAFLKKFGKNTVTQMQKDTAIEIRKRKAVKEGREMKVVEVKRAKDKVMAPDVVKFKRPKTPQDFVKHRSEQKRLFASLSHPHSPEQHSELTRAYYIFTAAGQLLKELGKEAFLDKFGKVSVAVMQRAAAAEIKQRNVTEKRRIMVVNAKDKVPRAGAFLRPKTPNEFVEHWEERKRLFEDLPRPLTPEQKSILNNTYYKFTKAGRLLEDLGKEAFLQKFGGGSVEQMLMATRAEVKADKTPSDQEKRQTAVGSAKAGEDNGAGGMAIRLWRKPIQHGKHGKCLRLINRPTNIQERGFGSCLCDFGKKCE